MGGPALPEDGKASTPVENAAVRLNALRSRFLVALILIGFLASLAGTWHR
jgi:hypothetical protein